MVNIHVIIIPKAGERTEKILEEITEKFTTLMKTINQSISLSVAENQGYKKESLKRAAEKKGHVTHTRTRIKLQQISCQKLTR